MFTNHQLLHPLPSHIILSIFSQNQKKKTQPKAKWQIFEDNQMVHSKPFNFNYILVRGTVQVSDRHRRIPPSVLLKIDVP